MAESREKAICMHSAPPLHSPRVPDRTPDEHGACHMPQCIRKKSCLSKGSRGRGFPEGPCSDQLWWTLHSSKRAAVLEEEKQNKRQDRKVSRARQEEIQGHMSSALGTGPCSMEKPLCGPTSSPALGETCHSTLLGFLFNDTRQDCSPRSH